MLHNALDLNQVPMGVRAMAQTENLTAVGLGCDALEIQGQPLGVLSYVCRSLDSIKHN